MNPKSTAFDPLLETFENEDIKNFAKVCIGIIPDYFWEVPASSSGKYHPAYALGEGGLVRHTYALVSILNYIIGIQAFKEAFSSRQCDLMRLAGIMHDAFKSGTQDNYEKKKHTLHHHPMIAAEQISKLVGFIPEDEMKFLCNCIASHMGEWNTSKYDTVALPVPKTFGERVLHLADYLASRKDIEFVFEKEIAKSLPSEDDYIFTFGKHKGKSFALVKQTDPTYLTWCKDNVTRYPIPELIKRAGI